MQRAALIRLWLLAAGIVALTVAAAYAMQAAGDNPFMVLALASGLLALASTRVAEQAETRKALWLIIGVAVLLRGILLALDPLLSSDIYRYVWDGKVQAAGINPYRYFPNNEALIALRDSAIYPNINRADAAVTIYPPVAQMFFFLVTRLGENITTMKLALVACESGIAFAILAFLRRLGRPPTRLVAYAWHPLPAWEIANNGHVDALMVMLMMLGLWFALTGRPLRGAAAITLGALAKPFALLALPAAWRPWDWKVPALVLAAVVLCYLPYLSVGSGVFGYFTTGYIQEESLDTGSAFWIVTVWRTLFGITRADVVVYLAAAAIVLVAFGIVAAMREPRSIATGLADINRLLLVFLLLLSPNYPWYFLMVTPFVALRGGAPNWTMSLGAILLQNEVDWDHYVPYMVRETILYGAFLAACGYAAWRARQKDSIQGGRGDDLTDAR
ncbi:MAG: glycosyltransferase 87 family protein [Xanthobacteraceae bacterium]